jgi:Mn2+/Fe2+ NRAMP family transporter
MVLVLLRFFFGFAMAWLAFTVLTLATLLCIKLIKLSIRLFEKRSSQDLVSSVCIVVVVVAVIETLYCSGYKLYDLLATLSGVQTPRSWLAGSSHVSLVALLGAVVAIGLPAYFHAYISRRPPGQERRNATTHTKSDTGRPIRIGWGPWTLVALGTALLALAYAIAPLASLTAIQQYPQYAERIWPVYVAAAMLLAAGLLWILIQIFGRRYAQIDLEEKKKR